MPPKSSREFMLSVRMRSDQPEAFLLVYVRSAVLEALSALQDDVENVIVTIAELTDVHKN